MKITLVSILISAFLGATGIAQNLPNEHHILNFDHYIYSEETPFVPANVVIQDQQGYMWFGTQWGVYRYDGYSSDHFNATDEVNPQIIQNEVNALIEDHTGALWIGTNGGLTRIDSTHQNSSHFLNNPAQSIRKLFQSTDRTIWIGTNNGLQSIHPETMEIMQFNFDPNDPNTLPDLEVLSMAEDSTGALWISFHISRYSSALVRLDVNDHSVTAFYTPKDTDTNPFLDWAGILHPTVYISYINAICASNTGDLWLGSWLGRLAKFNPSTFEFERRIPENYFHQDLHRNVNKIIEDSEGVLWITSEELGISRYDPQTNSAWIETHDRFRTSSISDFNVSDIYFDTFQNLWVLNSGVIDRFDPNKHNVREFHFREGNRYATVYRDILEDDDSNIWMATAEGLHRYNPKTYAFTSFYPDPDQDNSLSDKNITSLSLDNNNKMWVGTNARGVQVLDLETLSITPFDLFPGENSSNKGHIHDIEITPDESIWFGTRYSGLVKYDPHTHELEQHFLNPLSKSSEGEKSRFNTITTIYAGTNGHIWFGELNSGLFKYDPNTKYFTYFQGQTVQKSNQLFGININDILEDKDGNLWIATEKGINIYDIESGTFDHLTREDGLPPSSIQSLLYNEDETIWLSSKNNGIYILDIATNEIKHFYKDPNHPVNTFDDNSSWKGKDGTLYFGSILNLVAISPEMQKQDSNPIPPEVIISSINVQGSIYFNHDVHLDYWQNTITIKYSIVHFTDPSKNQSKYSFSSNTQQEEYWVEADGKNTVSFYDLAPGSYTFKLFGANNDGIWTEKPTIINLFIALPFWDTWWFRVTVLIGVIAVIVSFIQWRLFRIRHINQQLEKEVNTRTSELQLERDYSNQIIDSTPSIILGFSPDGLLTFLNPAASELFDIKDNNFSEQHWWSLAVEPDEQNDLQRIHQQSLWSEKEKFESIITTFSKNTLQIDWNLIHRYDEFGHVEETIAIGNDITERIQKEVIDVSNREQQRIGQEIHDSLCQELTGIGLMCESLIRLESNPKDHNSDTLIQISKHIQRVTTQSRHLAHGLYLHELEQSGLEKALEELTYNIQALFSIPCSWTCKHTLTNLDFDQSMHVYRIVQESLSNAVKYSQSKEIHVSAECENSKLCIHVVDDGVGFIVKNVIGKGMGIKVMQFRARMLNAKLEIKPNRKKGTAVLLTLPI